MQVIYKNINELKPYENNARINTESINLVAESIKNFGFKVPILIDKTNTIIAGHTRYEASKMLKLDKIPVILLENLTEEQIKAFRLVDNKTNEFATWDELTLQEELKNIKDYNMELLGFIKEENDIDWEKVEDLTEDLYEEPEHKNMECPYCHHIDRDIHFKKIKL